MNYFIQISHTWLSYFIIIDSFITLIILGGSHDKLSIVQCQESFEYHINSVLNLQFQPLLAPQNVFSLSVVTVFTHEHILTLLTPANYLMLLYNEND